MGYRKREYLSISTLLSFARCPRRYFYQKNGLGPIDESPALSYGTAMHKAVPPASVGDFDGAWDAFSSVWDDANANDTRNNDRAYKSLKHYCHTHTSGRSLFKFIPPPAGNIEVSEEVHEYEVPFAIDIGLPIPLVGRIDGLVEHRDTGRPWGYEFKTAGRMNVNFFDSFEMNIQILTYALVLRTLTGDAIQGVMVEGMLCDGRKVENMVHPVYVQDHHIEDIVIWLKNQGQFLLAMEAQYLSDGVDFPKDFTGCSAYTNFWIPSRRCEFSDLCRVPEWQMAKSLYAERPEHRFFTALTTGETK